MMYTYSVHRTQILLEESQYEGLMTLSRRTGKGLSELVRSAVDRLLGREPGPKSKTGLRSICGIASDHAGPSGRDHDRVLYGEKAP